MKKLIAIIIALGLALVWGGAIFIALQDETTLQASGEPRGGGEVSKATIFNQPGVFYRMEAEFEWLETGERLNFDYVVSCFNHETSGSYAPSLLPASYFLPTRTGEALQIMSFNLCNSGGDWPSGPEVGNNPWPLAVTYDDVNDLRWGWGYPNYHAYENPNAKIKFIAGRVTKTDRAAFMSWYEKAERDYEQIGALPGPHGAQANPKKERKIRNKAKNSGAEKYAHICYGLARVPVTDKIRKVIQELAPTGITRFYAVYPNQELGVHPHVNLRAIRDFKADLIYKVSDVDGNGHPLSHYTYPIQTGVVGADGKGSFYYSKREYSYAIPVYYPYTGYYYPPQGLDLEENVVPTSLFLDGDHAGFVRCGNPYRPEVEGLWPSKFHELGFERHTYILGELQGFEFDHASFIFDTEGAVFLGRSAGGVPTPVRHYPRRVPGRKIDEIKTKGLK